MPWIAIVVIAVIFVAVVVLLAAEVWAMVVAFVAGIQGIGFELCGVEDLAPRRILHYNADSELDCGADSDCYYTDSMSSGGTDETSC